MNHLLDGLAEYETQTSHEDVSIRDTEDQLLDLELMHHYTQHTCRTALSGEASQYVWLEYIPREASKHWFLMHGIIALAAIHQVHRQPTNSSKYLKHFEAHQGKAIALYRRALSDITDATANALFALSSIMSITSLASATWRSSNMPGIQHIGIDGICETLLMTRGSREVNLASGNIIRRGPLSVMLTGHVVSSSAHVNLNAKLVQALDHLTATVNDGCANPEHLRLCTEALIPLREIYEAAYTLHSRSELQLGHIWRWTSFVPYDFITLVQASFPPALIITSYFVVVANMKRDTWYVNMWGNLALEGICIALDGQLAGCMAWPREQIALDNDDFKQ